MATENTTLSVPVAVPTADPPAIQPKPGPAPETDLAPVSPNEETDKHVSEALEEKRKKKHGAEARIQELTKSKRELAAGKQELEAKLAAQDEANRRKVEAEAANTRPVREGFQNDAEFSNAMAKWVIRQHEALPSKVATPGENAGIAVVSAASAPATAPPATAPAPKAESAPAPVTPSPDVQVRQQEFDRFLTNGREFVSRNPDFSEVLKQATERGLDLSGSALITAISQGAPESLYWLARPENETEARRVMNMSPFDQSCEVVRIAERLKAHPSDFISNAPRPGQRINGNGRMETAIDENDVDGYLARRKEEIRTGQRRGRR